MRPFQGLSYSFMHTLFLLHVYDQCMYNTLPFVYSKRAIV